MYTWPSTQYDVCPRSRQAADVVRPVVVGEDRQDQFSENDIQHRGLQRRVESRRDLVPQLPAGEAFVTRHCPGQSHAGDHDHQAAGEDGEHHHQQQEGGDGRTQGVVDDVGDRGSGFGQRDRVTCSQCHGDDEDEAEYTGREDGLPHRPGDDAFGVVGLLGQVGRGLETDDGEAPSRNPSIHGPAVVKSPKLQKPSAGTAPLLNRFEKSMSPRTAAAMSNRTVSATMPMSSRETKVLFTRSAHGVENPTSRACINSTIAVTTHAIVAVPS